MKRLLDSFVLTFLSVLSVEAANNASFVSQTVPTTVLAGCTFTISIEFKNTGTTAWVGGYGSNYKLGSRNPMDNTNWNNGTRIYFPSSTSIAPNTNLSITNYSITAPSSPGTYNFQWQMIEEGVQWFGALSTNVAITVLQVSDPDPSTLNNKVMFGYQGWFNTPTDGSTVGTYFHWCNNNNMTQPTTDYWPDISELQSSELYNTGLTLNNGQPAQVYSNFNTQTVARHFQWMQEYNLDGVFLQRFAIDLVWPAKKADMDKVLYNVKAGAEQYKRVFAVEYDMSDACCAPANRIADMQNDWMAIVDAGYTNSPSYIKHNGKPVLAIWGIGFLTSTAYQYTPTEISNMINFFENNPTPKYRCTLMGGVPENWRVAGPYYSVYKQLNIICPWSVGRYSTNAQANSFASNYTADLNDLAGTTIDYMPVVWPGFSWANKAPGAHNAIPRNNGDFYWKQVYNVINKGANMMFVAMFDEMDEGTAMFKQAPTQATVPNQNQFGTNGNGQIRHLSLDVDGYAVPSDWYLCLGNSTGQMLRNEIPLTNVLPATCAPKLPTKPTITANGALSFCQGGSVILDAGTGYSSYSWSNGITTQTNTITSSGTYSVTVDNGNGCSATSSATTVTVHPLPSVTCTPASAIFCIGDSVQLTANGANSYYWTPATGLSASTGAAVTATPNNTTTYTIIGVGSFGCTNTTTVTVIVHPLPTVVCSPASPSICIGDSIILTANGASTYSWSPSSGLSASTGATVIATPTDTTLYTIIGLSSLGCANTATITVTVDSILTPIITQNGSILTSSVATGNQWYLNNTIIPGATSQNYTPSQSGDYIVTVVDSNGCTATSVVSNYTAASIAVSSESQTEIIIYPNPNEGKFKVQSSHPKGGHPQGEKFKVEGIVIYNLVGERVYFAHRQAGYQLSIDLSSQPNGIYFLQVLVEGKVYNKKISKGED